MRSEVEIHGLSEQPDAVSLLLPEHLAEAGALRLMDTFKELLQSGLRSFVLDLSQTQLMTDAGLGALNHIKSQTKGQLIFLSPSEKIRTLFEAVGLSVPILHSVEEAQRKLQEG